MKTKLRRLAWRVGRLIYCRARGEPSSDDITRNGETYVQRCVVAAAAREGRFCAVDIGGNLGDWTSPLVAALPPGLR